MTLLIFVPHSGRCDRQHERTFRYLRRMMKPTRHNDQVHRAAANDTDLTKPRSLRLRVQRIVIRDILSAS